MKSQGRIELESGEGTELHDISMDATVDMQVTSTNPDGKWTLAGRFANVSILFDGESQQEEADKLANQQFAVTYDKDGKVVNITGLEQFEGIVDMRQVASQMNPVSIFPDRGVDVGESWPIDSTESSNVGGSTITETTKGTGTLKEVSDGIAFIEYDLEKQMTASSSRGPSMKMDGGGKVKTTLKFDLEKSRVTSSQSEMRIEATMQSSMGQGTETKHSLFTNSMNLDLVNK